LRNECDYALRTAPSARFIICVVSVSCTAFSWVVVCRLTSVPMPTPTPIHTPTFTSPFSRPHRRNATADCTGRVALVTGARVKIGTSRHHNTVISARYIISTHLWSCRSHNILLYPVRTKTTRDFSCPSFRSPAL
jgi:hypothetical protein